jgi:oxygen-independent coproporphyrinogen-3 oxidase
VEKGLVPAPDEDLAADMYEYACETLANLGYDQYEISNWTRPDLDGQLLVCQHNLQYWRNLPYLGCGAGGHGFAAGFRTENEINPQKYIKLLIPPTAASNREIYNFPLTPATRTSTMITREREMKETMLMGLRLVEEGVSKAVFEQRFGAKIEIVFKSEIDHLIGAGLLEWVDQDGERLRLTESGYLLGNQVFMEFV